MVTKVRKQKTRNERVPAVALPFMPTENPGHTEVMTCAQMLLTVAQNLFLGNPKPIVVALKAAEHAYSTSLVDQEVMTQDEVDENLVLGMKLAAILLEASDKQKKEKESGIVTPTNPGILDANGNPIVSTK